MSHNTNAKMNGKKSSLCVLLAGMLWGCMGILVRTMNEGGFTSLEVTAFRSLVTAALMLAGMALFSCTVFLASTRSFGAIHPIRSQPIHFCLL